jgi:hypothetical protein
MMHFNKSNNLLTWKDFPGFLQQRYFIEVFKYKCLLLETLVISFKNIRIF